MLYACIVYVRNALEGGGEISHVVVVVVVVVQSNQGVRGRVRAHTKVLWPYCCCVYSYIRTSEKPIEKKTKTYDSAGRHDARRFPPTAYVETQETKKAHTAHMKSIRCAN